MNELTKEQFDRLLNDLGKFDEKELSFLFDCYKDALEGAFDLKASNNVFSNLDINPIPLILYLVNEHRFYLSSKPNLNIEPLYNDEEYERLIISLAVDKYFTNEHLNYKMGAFANRFLVEVSTISLYLNFVLGMLSRYKQNNPSETLIVDIMNKGFSMGKCIINLLTEGFETEAFSTWRTLHENECILTILVKYGQPVIERYLIHMQYGVAFRGGLGSKEETDNMFIKIKEGMHEAGLKSKDMKRFIEYGWLLAIPNVSEMPDFKLNFRDGVERVADLRQYSKTYEMSSEIAHSSPLLIYSRKNYFYLITILNLYESFFRLEKIFSTLYVGNVSKEEQTNYLAMRKLYYGELISAYEMLKKRFSNLIKSGKKEELPPKTL